MWPHYSLPILLPSVAPTLFLSPTYHEEAANTTTTTYPVPGTPQAGEEILILAAWNDDPGVVTWPTGFTERGIFNNSSFIYIGIATKSWQAGDTFSMSWVNSRHLSGSIYRVPSGKEFDAISVTATTGTSTGGQAASVTTTAINTIAMALLGWDEDDVAIDDDPTKYPTNWTGHFTRGTGGGTSDVSHGAAERAFAAIGATGNAAWQSGTLTASQQYVGVQIAFRPIIVTGFNPPWAQGQDIVQ